MTDKPDQKKDPKIFIDEGWKAQVEAEKEDLRKKQEAEQAGQAEPGGPGDDFGPMPPASLSLLATTLATQAMVAMGLVADPLTNKAQVRLDQARHFIDTLQVLEAKTQGNRTPEETAVLDHLLHELRMGFVAVQQQQAAAEPTVPTQQQ